MRYFEKQSKKKKPSTIVGYGTAGAGVGMAGIAGSRLYHQLLTDPNLVHVVGGSPDYWKSKNFTNVFETQRSALADIISKAGVRANEYSSFNTVQKPGKYPIRTPNYGKPILEIDVGNRMGGPITTRLKRLLKGNVHYRMFSDVGPSNQYQPYFDGPTPFNTMKASKGTRHDRNIVPGGEVIPAHDASRKNIDVASIPKTFTEEIMQTPVNEKTRVTVSFGSGHNWRDTTFPDPKQRITSILEAFDEVYGKDKYTMEILGGKNISKSHEDVFKELESKKKIRYIPKIEGKEDMAKFIHGSDLHVFGAGSTAAEIAGTKGYKPKILSIIPKGDFSQFEYNTKWLKNVLGNGVESLHLRDTIDKTELVEKLQNLKKDKLPGTGTIRFGKADVAKIMATAEEDFLRKKKFTGKLGLAGLAAGVLGGALLLTNK